MSENELNQYVDALISRCTSACALSFFIKHPDIGNYSPEKQRELARLIIASLEDKIINIQKIITEEMSKLTDQPNSLSSAHQDSKKSIETKLSILWVLKSRLKKKNELFSLN